jgi:phytoene desaturase
MPQKRVAIVGAGPGGLSAAMLLAHKGFHVDVFEKAERIGGRTAEVVLGEYRFDLGPTFLMMKYVLDELFEAAGRSSADYLDCRPLDPMYRLCFARQSMLVRSKPEDMHDEIERCFPGEGEGLYRFLKAEEIRFRKLYPCLQRDYGSPLAFLSTTLLAAAPHIAMGRSLYDVLGNYFRSEDLRLAFTFQSKYLGMSPWDCPGLFAMIPYTEHAHGIYHVMGGLNRIPAALAAVAQEEGASVHTSCPVERVVVKDGRATGVELGSGERLEYDDVVINADFGHAMKTLFAGERLGKYDAESLAKRDYSCSTFMIYLGLDTVYPEAEHHMIVFAEDYRKCLDDITHHKVASDDLSIYVRNAAPLDPGCAPAGHSALYILAPAPNNTSGIDWELHRQAYRDRILDLLEQRTPYTDLRSHIRQELVITPADWESKMSVFLGATFNMGHSWKQMLYFRPHNEFELFGNTYLVGGGTHPGSGLPTIFESARISSNLICAKYGVATNASKPFSEISLS